MHELTESGRKNTSAFNLHEECKRDGRFEEIEVEDQKVYKLTEDVVIDTPTAMFVFCLGSQGGHDKLHAFNVPLFLDNVARRI